MLQEMLYRKDNPANVEYFALVLANSHWLHQRVRGLPSSNNRVCTGVIFGIRIKM